MSKGQCSNQRRPSICIYCEIHPFGFCSHRGRAVSMRCAVAVRAGCLTETAANYDGQDVLVPFNYDIVNSSEACCSLCQNAQSGTLNLQYMCNSWIW